MTISVQNMHASTTINCKLLAINKTTKTQKVTKCPELVTLPVQLEKTITHEINNNISQFQVCHV